MKNIKTMKSKSFFKFSFFSILMLGMFTVISAQNIEEDNQLQIITELETKYIIGIGNEEIGMFNDVLANLQNSSTLKVYAVCETHRIIGITVQNSAYKSYDVLRDQLLNDYPTLLLLKKDETIFNLDCKNEILKQ